MVKVFGSPRSIPIKYLGYESCLERQPLLLQEGHKALKALKPKVESEKNWISEMYCKFNLQSIVKFLIIVVGWQSFEDDASLVVRESDAVVGGALSFLLYRINETILG